ncbi:MAG: sigma-54-dependent Fis family transcriptional regulator [Deltaproteobacteria bacterium]|nr:sigma-54-dependent Fis family transcriptional regulator [Deltaproteobacteria bacterium]
MPKSLLIADDEELTLSLLKEVFSSTEIRLHLAKSGKEAISILNQSDIDVVLTDFMMPGVDGLGVLTHAKKVHPKCEVIMMTAFGTVENAVQAMKMGAFHYITKPFKVMDVTSLVGRALELTSIRKENIHLKTQAIHHHSFDNIIGVSGQIRQVLDLVRKVADSDSTVLVLGESGTGKELIARAIHYNSKRADRMLVAVNCSAIPAELLESELFGHVKGAYTGAHVERSGRFEMAHRGTIFLDEIGEMSPPLQAKLLRVLQEQSFIPVGGTKTVNVDVRVIAATNRELEREIIAGRFRQDLFFRLNVIPIHIPPLRERIDDIPVLVGHFLEKWNRKMGRQAKGFRPDATERLMRYPWPGNVRELENIVERLVVLKYDGWFETADLPPAMQARGREPASVFDGFDLGCGSINLREATGTFQHRLIENALTITKGNKNKAAALLGLKRTTLLEMLKRRKQDCQELSDA